MRSIVALLVVAVSLLAIGCNNPLKVQTKSVRADGKRWHASAEIVKLTGAPIALAASKEANALSMGALNEFVRNAKQQYKDFPKMAADGEFTLHSRVTIAQPHLVSFLIEGYSFSGGAHGIQLYFPRTFITEGNKARRMTFADLAPGDGRRTLEADILDELRGRKASWVVSGEVKTLGALRENFYIDANGVNWIFPQYSMGPYVEGAYKVTRSFMELSRWHAEAIVAHGPKRA